MVCVDAWTVKQVLAIRAWWTVAVVGWIEAGRTGATLELPAPGFGWNETPRLNASIAAGAAGIDWTAVVSRLEQGYRAVISTIDSLDDRELLEPGVFDWAGKWPIARWISINTTRQYTTARKYVRRALRDSRSDAEA